MCTAITYKTRDFYFGRNLDLEYHYSESVTVTPRRFRFDFGETGALSSHYAIIGIATVADNYPLYYDAVNEKGLCAAGLAFAHTAKYHAVRPGKDNVASYELIPWLLVRCSSAKEAREAVSRVNITDEAFSEAFPPTPLHWIVADREEAFVIESTSEGVKLYDNPVGVLTNEPTFDHHMMNLNNYMNLSAREPIGRFADNIELCACSRGMGALGLPGDNSSQSRFVRAAFNKLNSVSGDGENESVCQFFHILGSVEQTKGSVRFSHGGGERLECTVYASCCNADRGIYYYTTYENPSIVGVNMRHENTDGDSLCSYPLRYRTDIGMIN